MMDDKEIVEIEDVLGNSANTFLNTSREISKGKIERGMVKECVCGLLEVRHAIDEQLKLLPKAIGFY